jgi:hypothetical protein
MASFLDAFGATVTGDEETGWVRDGITIGPCSQSGAFVTFSGMAPDGWVPPGQAAVVPESVTAFQIKAALHALPAISGPGTLYDEINSLLTSVGGVSYLAWEYATEVTRNGQLVNSLANQLGWTQTQLDDLFVTASNIFS